GGVGDRRPEELTKRMVAEAHPEQRDAQLGAPLDDGEARPGLLRGARARGDQHAGEVAGVGGQLVVALDHGLGTELFEVPDDGPDEAVVVVDDKEPGHAPSSMVISLKGMCGAIWGKSQ